jgi:hypothetical protein
MRQRGRIALALLVVLAAAPSSASATTTFGANLGRAPDNPYTCGSFGFQSCSWESIQLTTGESGFPPVGTGRISRVRVRVGSVTGPMQIVVEEALRQDNPADPGHPTYACCKAINLSQVFTPAPNAITTVAVNLPVRQDAAPDPNTGYYVDDHLALSVLDPNVPIPASSDGNASDGGWFPAWQLGQERCCPYGTAGFVILFNADWDPADSAPGTGGSPPGGGGGGAGGVPITLGKLVRDSTRGTARLGVTVPGAGLLRLIDAARAAGSSRAAVAKKKALIKSIKRNTKKPGKVTVKIKPSKAGKAILRKKGKLKVKVRISFTPAGGTKSTTATKKIKLKLKRN